MEDEDQPLEEFPWYRTLLKLSKTKLKWVTELGKCPLVSHNSICVTIVSK
jgi:hypothetical protein